MKIRSIAIIAFALFLPVGIAACSEDSTGDLDKGELSDELQKEGLSADEARFEAGRCLSCGNCFECDGCLGSCPEDAVIKLGPGNRFRFDYDYCKGCGLCAAECPCGAIDMVPEAI